MPSPALDEKRFKGMLTRAVMLPLVLLAILAGVLFWQIKHLLYVAQSINRKDEVISQANHLQKLLIDMETGLRGYLFTHNPAFLDPYNKSLPLIEPELERLRGDVADNPVQLQRIKEIGSLYAQWGNHAKEAIALRGKGEDDQARANEVEGKRLMDNIRVNFSSIIQTEEDLRNERSQQTQYATSSAIVMTFGLTLLLGSIIALVTRRQLIGLSESYRGALSAEKERGVTLQERERFIQAIADSSPNILYVYDIKEQRNVYVNRGVSQILGYDPEEIQRMGSSLIETLMHPDDLDAGKEFMHKFNTTSNGEVFDIEYRMRHKDGGWRWLWSRDSVFKRQGDGSPQQILGTARDITDRRKAEEERERFFVVGADMLLIAGFDGTFKWLSPGWEKALGWSNEELTSLPWLHFVHPDDHERTIAEAEKLSQGQDTISFENRYRHQDGSYRWISWRVRPYPQEQLLYGAANDVTERKELEEQFRQSQKLESVGHLAGGIAHDFNNLLTAINGYSDLALRRIGEDEPIYRNIKEIRKAGERAATLTRQLLAFSRKQVMQPKVFNLNELVENMSNLLRRLIGEDVELSTRLSPTVGRISADPGQIEQVLTNLVVNARDAMPKGGKLTVETSNTYLDERYSNMHMAVSAGQYVMLVVSDTGRGMDTGTQQQIFEPFFTTKEVGKGTGLGLSTAYGIVKQSGGNIWVYSEIGKGTTFKIYFPRVDQEAETIKFSDSQTEMIHGTETILLVEDDSMVRSLARTILEESGYNILEAANNEEALGWCRTHESQIHLMLTDVVMPGMGGPELFEKVGSSQPQMRVLYMSGYTDESIVHHGVLAAGTDLLEKPFTPDALLRKVREVLDAASKA